MALLIIEKRIKDNKMWSEEDLTLADEQYDRDIDKLMKDGLYNKHREIINQPFSDKENNNV